MTPVEKSPVGTGELGCRLGLSLLVALPFSAACGAGGMGQISFQHSEATDKGGLASSLDGPLAVGGAVEPSFHFDVPGSAAPPTHFLSARPEIVDVHDGLLVGRSPGVSAVLVALDDDTVIDFIHVWVRPADRLEVHAIDIAGGDLGTITEPIELLSGDGLRLVPHPYARSDRLIGVGTSSWTVEPPIAVVLREGLPNRIRLVARTPGTADVKVTMLGATAHIKLTVL